jgi:hypothetical protein
MYGRIPRSSRRDCEREADHRAEQEARERLLAGEPRRMQERVDQGRAAGGGRLPERGEHVVEVRHRRVVDGERPRPAGRFPEPLVALPQAPESCDDEEGDADPPGDRGCAAVVCRGGAGVDHGE